MCGGPVVDLSGKAVGVNIARAGRVETYAVPADTAKLLIRELRGGTAVQGEREADGAAMIQTQGSRPHDRK
jgi:S1-C subfamily serine protease